MAMTYKCPNCDGGLTFNPQTGQFHCAYCLSDFTQEQLDAIASEQTQQGTAQTAQQAEAGQTPQDDGWQQSGAQAQAEEELALYTCPSCGAQILTEKTTAATFCYYCHNPIVLSETLSGASAPDGVIPFAIDRDEAVKRFTRWIRSKKYVPRAFFNKQQIQRISGVYFPYWVAEVDVDAQMQAQGRTVRVWRAGDTEYTETKHYAIERAGSIHFADLSQNALKKANRKLVEGVQPFDESAVKPFSAAYLSGFVAQTRDVEQEEAAQALEPELDDYAQKLLRDTISGYGSVHTQSCTVRRTGQTFRCILRPVWVLTYQGEDQMYYYAMNGQTGKVCGELPTDGRRLWTLFAQVSVPLFALLTIGAMLL